jgi:hypothetical protein
MQVEVNFMKVWLLAVAVLFVLVQLFEWVKGFMLPLPVYILGGAFLAIASNYEQGLGSLFSPSSQAAVLGKPTETKGVPPVSE